jgi:hypothetical protein
MHVACAVVARHQETQKELARLQADIKSKKNKVVSYAAQLRRSQEDIADVLRKHQTVLHNARQKTKGAGCFPYYWEVPIQKEADGPTDGSVVVLDPRDVVAYAHRIAGTTSAPREWRPGVCLSPFPPDIPLNR